MSMLQWICCIGGVVCLSLSSLTAQKTLGWALDAGQTHERLLVVCPLVGKGTYDDPIRPALTPAKLSRQNAAKGLDLVMGFAWTRSDDGKSAIVELVLRDGAAVSEFRKTAIAVTGAQLFERGKDSPASIDVELKKVKRNFDRRELRALVP